MPKLVVLYPPPTDVQIFEGRYRSEHVPLEDLEVSGWWVEHDKFRHRQAPERWTIVGAAFRWPLRERLIIGRETSHFDCQ